MQGKTAHIKNLSSHPLVQLKDQNELKLELQKLSNISIQYGSACAMQRQIERTIAGSFSRQSTIPTSNHSLKLLMGKYDKVEFSDYLGRSRPIDVDQSVFYKADKGTTY